MTRDEVVAIIKARLLRADDTTLDAKIITEMKFVQEQLLENAIILPWFLISEFETISTTANEERLPIPPGFLREHEECSLWIYNTSAVRWDPLTRDDYDFLSNKFPTAGTPSNYALDGAYFRLKPTPNDIFTIRTRFYLRDTTLSSNIQNNWLLYASDLLVAEVGKLMSINYLKDVELGKVFIADITRAQNRLGIVDEARKHTNRDYMMGDN